MSRAEKKSLKKQKSRLDRILYLISLGMLAATVILDEMDRRKREVHKNGG